MLPADLTQEGPVAAAFAAITAAWQRVGLLAGNAGIFGVTGDPDEISPAEWHTVVAVNLTRAFLCAREAFAVMKRQRPSGGRIINNGSISAHVPGRAASRTPRASTRSPG